MKTSTISALAALSTLLMASACSLIGGGKANKPSTVGAASAEPSEDVEPNAAEPVTCGDTTCDPAVESCSDGACVARQSDQPIQCGDNPCTKNKPLCVKNDKGAWGCVGADEGAMFAYACRTKDNCGEGQQCCKGMGSRCVDDGECGGGDTPLIACAALADCPDSWYGNEVTQCEPLEDDLPGVKLCR